MLKGESWGLVGTGKKQMAFVDGEWDDAHRTHGEVSWFPLPTPNFLVCTYLYSASSSQPLRLCSSAPVFVLSTVSSTGTRWYRSAHPNRPADESRVGLDGTSHGLQKVLANMNAETDFLSKIRGRIPVLLS